MFSSGHTPDSRSLRPRGIVLLGLIGWLLAVCCLLASDHADPIDYTRLKPLEPVITDLFVFPVDHEGAVVKVKGPAQTKSLIVILCVRRALTKSDSLNLEPYTYRIHMDTQTKVGFDTQSDLEPAEAVPGSGYSAAVQAKGRPTSHEAFVRYGGAVDHPENITDDVAIEITLNNDASMKTFDARGLINPTTIAASRFASYAHEKFDPDKFQIVTGIRDDPFIFPAFFGTNVVAMVLNIPIHYFREGQQDWLIWATSHKGRRQIDHVGRSLRTQNPRFELLNTLPPSEHVSALKAEHENPGLMRDLALRLNIQSLFAYRQWDFVPDVMIYTNRYPAGFPNGRLPTDDVAAILAQHGDTLLLELSHHNAQWPRRTINDKPFSASFPYLAEPWPDRDPPEQHHLSWKNTLILVVIAIVTLLILFLATWQFVRILAHVVRWWFGFRPRSRCVL